MMLSLEFSPPAGIDDHIGTPPPIGPQRMHSEALRGPFSVRPYPYPIWIADGR